MKPLLKRFGKNPFNKAIMRTSQSNIANFITISRIFGVAYIFWLMPFSTEKDQLLIIFLFTVVALTDA